MAEKVDAIAEARHVSASRAIVDLLADGIEAHEQRRKAFLELADRFQNPKIQRRQSASAKSYRA
jgi:hypothetical protein